MNTKNHERYEYVGVGAFWEIQCLFRRDIGGGYRVTAPEIPDMLAFGDTLEEARENAREDLLVCLPGSEALDDHFRDVRG